MGLRVLFLNVNEHDDRGHDGDHAEIVKLVLKTSYKNWCCIIRKFQCKGVLCLIFHYLLQVNKNLFSLYRNNPTHGNSGGNIGFSGRGNVRGRGRGRGGQPLRGGRIVGGSKVSRGAISSGRGRSNNFRGGVNTGRPNVSRNFTVSISNAQTGFDARAKISAIKQPSDAREKLTSRGKQTDARSKIANIKAKKMGKTTNDARMFISNKKSGQGGTTVRIGAGDSTSNIPLKRTVSYLTLLLSLLCCLTGKY